MPLIETKGAASAQGFGEFAQQTAANYIEDVFQTWLYTGNGSTQTITNGIDLAGKGGLVWIKSRSASGAFTGSNNWCSTAQGPTNFLISDGTQYPEQSDPRTLTAFNSNGFSLGTGASYGFNANGATQASWTFRKQPKFFDVVTWTGDGTSNRAISHSLGSAPGCIIARRTDAAGNWNVYHRGVSPANDNTLTLNTTSSASGGGQDIWGNGVNVTTPTTTSFYVAGQNNNNGATYVAYLFAHNAGGFGLTGTDNVISCGSFTGSGAGVATTITLGYEPQFILAKRVDAAQNWIMVDTMRGLSNTADALLYPNLANAESSQANTGYFTPTATGFVYGPDNFMGDTAQIIYIAIRRGPMKTPTTGTSVFNPVARTGTGTNPTVVTTGNNPDLLMSFPRTASPAAYGMLFWDKLRGVTQMLESSNTNAETAINSTRTLQGWTNTGYQAGADFIDGYLNYSGSTYVNYPITRAPGFFDVVCYTGTGSATTFNHNLGVAPELIIVKMRSATRDWGTGWTPLGWTQRGPALNSTETSFTTSLWWNNTAPTSSVFTVGTSATTNQSASTYVAYLFASCPGVSKVGSYTGSGTTKQIDCGFTGGARFVLIRRTDSAGDWYVWDSARGIVSGNDPYLLLNSTAAEVTNTDYIDTYSAGFEISSTAPAAINANGGTFVFLAVA